MGVSCERGTPVHIFHVLCRVNIIPATGVKISIRVVGGERQFLIDNLLVRIHLIVVMIRWTGLAPWECEFPFPGSLVSTFLGPTLDVMGADQKSPQV